jgi:hypothetical protein
MALASSGRRHCPLDAITGKAALVAHRGARLNVKFVRLYHHLAIRRLWHIEIEED